VRWPTLLLLLLVTLVSADARAAQARIASYRERPWGACRFALDQFGFTPDKWQEEVLVAFADPAIQRISMQACAGPGKTAVEAVCGWYFLATQCTLGEHPKGLCTSITGENLRDNLWAEFAKWQGRSDYLRRAFTWTATRIMANDHPETWFLAPRTWPKSGSAEEQGRTLSGLHSQNVLAIIDESGAIPPTVLRAGEQALSNTTFGKLLQGGNPISLEGCLHEAAVRLRHQWHVIRITGDPDDPNRSPRIDIEWAREQIRTYGRDNPWVKSYILGQFPPASINALLGIEDVEAAMARRLRSDEYDWAQKRIGVDVARFGDDRTCLFPRQGLQAFKPVVMRNARTTDIAARVAMAQARWGSELHLVDDTGHWGHGVIDNLVTAGIPALGINFAEKAINPRYRNRRAEMWIEMAEAIKGGVALPHVAELVAELTTPTYTFLNGLFVLEEKDQIKHRLGRSPDLADALALTWAIPDMPNEVQARLTRGRQQTATTDYDPYAKREA
jgi:phage terminase large subunit